MKLSFYSLSSGSSGNCYYIGNGMKGILIDAGIPAGTIRKFLRDVNISMESVMGVLITHNHTDHIRGLEVLVRKNNLPVFTTGKIWESIIPSQRNISNDCIREITVQKDFQIEGFNIEAFPVFHDAPETIGFRIRVDGKNISIATDLGHICQISASYLKESNFLVIESNYDEYMLASGSYPHFLKARIRSDRGHLGNHQASAFLAEIFNSSLSHICLAHLSKNNNTPENALQTLSRTFEEKGIKPGDHQRILTLNRNTATEMITISY
jgi:phosphoribosyl 1,2-cyclic phosphodiesterase